MGFFNQEGFNKLVLDNNVLGLFAEEKTLKSKRKSRWYVNWRLDDLFLLEQVADHVVAFVQDLGLDPNAFYGVPEGATRLGILSQFKWATQSPGYGPGSHILPMGRGSPKAHGDAKDRYFVGAPKGRIIVAEDVTTTATSILNTVANLRELSGVEVIAAVGLTNRMELTPIPGKDDAEVVSEFSANYKRASGKEYTEASGVEAMLRSVGVPYFALSEATALLPQVVRAKNPGESIVAAIEQEFREYGIKPINLR